MNERRSKSKVELIGTGIVGTSFAYSLMQHGVANELVLIDMDAARAEGEWSAPTSTALVFLFSGAPQAW
jgi:L-lactate dehydrogenase